MWIVAIEMAIVLASSTLLTPLYLIYRSRFGFSELVLTLIYAVYVVGNLVALFIFGRLSDQIGRKRATWPALAVAVLATIAFALAQNTAWLFVARLLSGFATGLGSGTATAWIAELHPRRDKHAATQLAAAATLGGLGFGPLLAGYLARYSDIPLVLPYLVYLAMLAAVSIAVLFAKETVDDDTAGSSISLRPRLGVPSDIRSSFTSPAVTAFGIFALTGFYAALIPGLLSESLHQSSPATSGIVVFELFGVGAATTVILGAVPAQKAMLSGLVVLLPSLLLLILSESQRSMPLLIAGTALGGISAALAYRGSLEVVNEIAPDEKRSEVVSAYLIASYLGNSAPVIGVGFLSHATTPFVAHVTFAGVVGLFAIVGLVTGLEISAICEMIRPRTREVAASARLPQSPSSTEFRSCTRAWRSRLPCAPRSACDARASRWPPAQGSLICRCSQPVRYS